MKRDMELVRQILLALEETDRFRLSVDELVDQLPNANRNSIVWHLVVMEEGGLVALGKLDVSTNWKIQEHEVIETVRIHWNGHEFIAAAMNETVWRKAQRQAGDMFKSLSLGTLLALLQAVMKQELGLQ